MPDSRGISPIFGVLAAVIALTAVGCGGSGDSETAAASISKAEFVKKANRICAKAEDQLISGLNEFAAGLNGKEPKGAALVAAQTKLVETVVVPVKRQEAEQLREIGAPASDEDQVEAMVNALNKGTDEATSHPEEAVTGAVQSFVTLGRLADQYGLKGC